MYLPDIQLVHRIDLRSGAVLPDLTPNYGAWRPDNLVAFAPSGALVFVDATSYHTFDAVTGRQLWSVLGRRTGPAVLGVEQGSRGRELLYVLGPQAIEAREARTGSLRWTVPPYNRNGASSLSEPTDWFQAARGSQVVEAMGDMRASTYRGLDAQTRAVRWSLAMGPSFEAISPGGKDVLFARLAAGEPPLVLGVVCSPAGVRAGRPPGEGCDSRRLVAVNW
jgi:hypothetical protein